MYDLKNIISTWNSRLKICINEAGYKTQKDFAKDFNMRYNTTCTQKDVSRWINVGSSIKGNKIIGFPSYINMIRLADFFNVDVGYLTGETNGDTFDQENIGNYLKLSPSAIKNLKLATSFDYAFKRMRMSDRESQVILNKLFTSDDFFFLMKSMHDLNAVYDVHLSESKVWKDLIHDLGYDLFQEALEYYTNGYDAKDISSRPELLSALFKLDEALENTESLHTHTINSIDIYKYRLFEAFNTLVNNLFPS